jgi:hypothetical protein
MQKLVDKEPYFYSNHKNFSFLTLTLIVIKAINIPLYGTQIFRNPVIFPANELSIGVGRG